MQRYYNRSSCRNRSKTKTIWIL